MENLLLNILNNVPANKYPTIYYGGWLKLHEVCRLSKELDSLINDELVDLKKFEIRKSDYNTYIKIKDVFSNLTNSDILDKYKKNRNMKIFKQLTLHGACHNRDKFLYLGISERTCKYSIFDQKCIKKQKKHFIYFTRDIQELFNKNIDTVLQFNVQKLKESGLMLYTYGTNSVFTDGHCEDGVLNLYGYPDNTETSKNSYIVKIIDLTKYLCEIDNK